MELVAYLLDRGMEVDLVGEEGMTALHYVSRWGITLNDDKVYENDEDYDDVC